MSTETNLKEIYLAGGCFWGTEKYLANISGIVKTDVGYANGNTENPTYQEVCHNNTGHAETVRVFYDSKLIRLEFILTLYYDVIDPTSINRQGGDTGSQYRTGIYYVDDQDLPVIQTSIKELQSHYDKPIAIEVLPLSNYYIAEEYHQKYLDKNPSGYCHIRREKFDQAKLAKDDML
jgi:peptide-methionine (S)-S-oxide reductase/peptide methionine sulfoxide reductase msrA/msrB